VSEEIKTNNTQASYRSIFKATSLFGGVQVYNIILGIVKSKFIAILLGPLGMGVSGLYTSATSLVQSISSLGLSNSAVRDVSEARGSENVERVNLVISVIKKLMWVTGLSGMIVVILLSPVLSKTTFGNNDYTIPFILLSCTLLFDQLCAGQKVVLQGMRRLKDLAKASAIGSTIGVIVSIPLYYLMGLNGIVPTLVLTSVTSLTISWLYSRKLHFEKVPLTAKQTIQEGKVMLRMGLALSLNGVLVNGSAYLLRSYIRLNGGLEKVGLFTAGFAIMNLYTGMVFNAIGTDYYPRLAAVNKDNGKCREIVNQQGEIGVLIIAPILMVCMIFMPLIVRVIYSKDFAQANDYILWASIGMMFKMTSWIVAYQFTAKGEALLFIINEIIVNVYSLCISVLGYNLAGLKGMGIAFSFNYMLYAIQVYAVANRRYGFKFNMSFMILLGVVCIMLIGGLAVSQLLNGWLMYGLGCCLIALSCWFSYVELDKRMNIKSLLPKFGYGKK